MLFGLREVFRDIFHPTRSGTLSDYVGRSASFVMRHTRMRGAAGPLALVATIFCWIATLNLGFALIYCGLATQRVVAVEGSAHVGAAHAFLRGLYFSLGAFDTFQTFDLEPKTDWLRLVVSVEGLIGISMITASVSWLVLLYPALSRMRFFARRTAILISTEERTGLPLVAHLGVPVMIELAQAVTQFRLDVILFPILLNFYAADRDATVSFVLPRVHHWAEEAVTRSDQKDLVVAGTQLQIALEELAHTLADRVVLADEHDLRAVFKALQRRDE